MKEITKRIRQIMADRKLSNASFADEIDIPRPVVSHILTGRNQPSLQVILQILRSFPNVSPSWLLLGADPETEIISEPAENKVSSAPPPVYGTPASETLPDTMLLVEGHTFRIIRRK